MSQIINNSKELLDDFFNNIEKIPKIDESITIMLKKLYQEDKFSYTNIINALTTMRESTQDDKS